MVLSVLLHLAVAVGWILFPGFGRTAAPPEDVFFVDVVGGVPSTPAAQATPPPQESVPAVPEPEPEGARVETREVTPQKPEKPKPEPEPEPEKPTPPPPATSRTGRSEAEPSETSPDLSIPEGPSGSGDSDATITSLDLGDMEHAWYRDSVVMALRNHWVRPILQGIRQTMEVTLAFEIGRDGSVRNPRIESSSGVPSLDRSALRAVADASPLPPLPHSWREPVVPARFVFRLQPEAD